jgi:hypothetical protein
MALTGAQAKKLSQAILSAFSGDDLEQLVRFDLNERLDNIVPAGPLSTVVLRLIEWAENNGATQEFLQAIQRARPNNQNVQSVVKELAVPATGGKPPPGTAPLDGPRKARLRAVLLDQFPTRSALKMLVDDTLSVNLDGVTTGANLTETVFELIQWAAIDPAAQLRPLLNEAVRQRPGSKELKSLKLEVFGD